MNAEHLIEYVGAVVALSLYTGKILEGTITSVDTEHQTATVADHEYDNVIICTEDIEHIDKIGIEFVS